MEYIIINHNGTPHYIVWDDPDPIEGNDYRVKNIILNGEIATITYGGYSEAQVFLNELRLVSLSEYK